MEHIYTKSNRLIRIFLINWYLKYYDVFANDTFHADSLISYSTLYWLLLLFLSFCPSIAVPLSLFWQIHFIEFSLSWLKECGPHHGGLANWHCNPWDLLSTRVSVCVDLLLFDTVPASTSIFEFDSFRYRIWF